MKLLRSLMTAACLLAAAAGVAEQVDNTRAARSADAKREAVAFSKGQSYSRLKALSLGSITAEGWLKALLQRNKDGMGGHMDELEPEMLHKPFIDRNHNSPAGHPFGRLPGWSGEFPGMYWTGLVQLAFTLDDEELKAKAGKWGQGVLSDAGAVVLCSANPRQKRPVKIDIVGPAAFGGTFHSHNQKVLRNDNGTFMTYNGNGNWCLLRSVDGGRTFKTVYRGDDQTAPPVIETDSKDRVYLMHSIPNWAGVKFLRFTAANGYTSPDITKVYEGRFGGGKFAMAYDPGREQFYYASRGGYVLTIDKRCKLLRTQRVWRPDGGTGPQYPHLFLDSDGILHHAMTMTPSDNKPSDNKPWYDLIRYVKSTDGGASWQAMDGKALSVPTSCGVKSPSTLITLLDGDESTLYNTWLCSMHPKAGKVHFYYRAEVPGPDRIHYMRFNARTGAREIDSWTDRNNEFKGETISFASLFGAFASDPEDPSGSLYFVSKDQNSLNLAALVSFDNGSTWHDYARATAELWDPGALGRVGCSRVLTSDGKVIGSFRGRKGGAQRAFYFELPACSGTGTHGGQRKQTGRTNSRGRSTIRTAGIAAP